MDEARQWFYEIRVKETVNSLTKHGFDTIKVPDRYAACNEILSRIPLTKTVGFGGSITLREIGRSFDLSLAAGGQKLREAGGKRFCSELVVKAASLAGDTILVLPRR